MKKHLFLSALFALLFGATAWAQSTPEIDEVEFTSLSQTTIQFDEVEYNFGKVRDGEKVRHIYRFTNIGTENLVLTNAKGSCGCTVPSWPQAPIPPGGTGAIVVEFDTKGKTGPQIKQVTITANTDPPQSILYVKGEVLAERQVPPMDAVQTKAPVSPISETASIEPNSISLSAYPMPATNLLNLEVSGHQPTEPAQVEVYSATGQLVQVLKLAEAGTAPMQLDVSKLADGNYWASVKIGGHDRASLPFVVAR